jgi:hypothetical protein
MNQEKSLRSSNFVALLWSIAMPGLGHLYLRNKIIGIILIGLTLFALMRTNFNEIIFYAFAGNFKKANLIFTQQPVLFFPAIYSFAMWHAYNYEIIAGNGSKREYKLTGFFFGFTIGGVPGMSHRFLGTHIFTGLAIGVVMGIIFHLLEKLILFIKRDKTKT